MHCKKTEIALKDKSPCRRRCVKKSVLRTSLSASGHQRAVDERWRAGGAVGRRRTAARRGELGGGVREVLERSWGGGREELGGGVREVLERSWGGGTSGSGPASGSGVGRDGLRGGRRRRELWWASSASLMARIPEGGRATEMGQRPFGLAEMRAGFGDGGGGA